MSEHDTDLELKFDADRVALKHLVAASGTFAQLISEVARKFTDQSESITWFVEVKPGSVCLPVHGLSDSLADNVIPSLCTAIASGISEVNAEPVRPRYFSDKALEQLKSLTRLSSDELPISVRNGGSPVLLTAGTVANIDEFFGPPKITYGTIEGKLDAVQLHGKNPTFSVYETLSGNRVECKLTESITLDELRRGIGCRVGVRGRIKSRGNGERVSIEPEELDIFPPEIELPSPSEVRGILRGYE